MFGLNLGTLTIFLRADASQFRAQMSAAEALIAKTAAKIEAIGRKMTLRLSVPLGLVGTAAVKAFADFDDAMTKTMAIMEDATPKIREEMEAQAKAISGRSVTSIKKLGEAYYFLISAGYDAAQAIKALPEVERFAVAGAFSVEEATSLLADAQHALGLSFKDPVKNMKELVRVSDVLIKANIISNATTEQLSHALTYKAASALKVLNKSVEEGVAALSAFANQGIKGNIAGEWLYIVLRDLQRAAQKNSGAWRQFGMRVYDTHGEMLPIADIIGQMEQLFSNLSDAQKKAAAEMLGFQDRSFAAIQVLVGTSAKMREYQKQLEKAGGTTEKVAKVQLTSFMSNLKILWNNVTIAAAALGEAMAPALLKVGEKIKELTSWFKGLSDTTKKWIGVSLMVLVVLGPTLLLISMMFRPIMMLTRGVMALTVAMMKMSGKTLLLIEGLAAILIVTWAIVDAFSEADLGIWNWYLSMKTVTGEKIGTVWERMGLRIQKVLHEIGVFAKGWWEFMKYGFSEFGHSVWGLMQKIWYNVERGFNWLTTRIAKGLIWLMERALDVMDAVDVLGLNTDKIEGARGVLVAWKEGIDLSRSASELAYNKAVGEIEASRIQRQQDHEKAVLGIKQDDETWAKDWKKRMDDAEHKAFLEKLPEELRKKPAEYQKAGDKDPGGWGALGEKMKKAWEPLTKAMEDGTKGMADSMRKQMGDLSDLMEEGSGLMPGSGEGEGKKGYPQEFKEMSLRRFGLEPVPAARSQRQEVYDEGANITLKGILEAIKNKKPAAVLG